MSETKVARGGAFCGPVGATAQSSVGSPLICAVKPGTKTRPRWRLNGDSKSERRASPGRGRRRPTILEMNRRQLLAEAKNLGITLKRGEPDDDIRTKIQKAAGAEGSGPMPRVDAIDPASLTPTTTEVSPVTEPAPPPPPAPEPVPAAQPAMPGRSAEELRPPNHAWGVDQGLMHFDSAIGRLWNELGDDRHLEVDGRALGNVVCDLGENITWKKHDTNDALAELKRIRTQLPDDCDAARRFDRAITRLDAPDRPAPELPEDTPEPIKKLMADLNNINLVRRGGDEGMRNGAHGTHETDFLAEAAWKWTRGELSGHGWTRALDHILGMRHESMEGWTEIRTFVFPLLHTANQWGRRKPRA